MSVLDNLDFGDNHHSFRDHFVECREDGLNLFLLIHDGDHHRHAVRQMEEPVLRIGYVLAYTSLV